MKPITSWKDRLEAMDHSRGTSHKMIEAAMLEEIKERRQFDRCAAKICLKTEALQRELVAEKRKARQYHAALVRVTNLKENWKQQALKYRKQILERP